jgi:predicted phage terminase large subunit-like protein
VTALSPTELYRQTLILIDRQICRDSLHEFVKAAWHVIEPGVPFVDGFHIQAICEHLQAITEGKIRYLLINIPPRHAKSTIVSVLWPCWEWIRSPQEKFLCASYSGILSTRDNLKARRLITSPWYQDRWGDIVQLTGDQNQKTRFENTATGYRIASSVGGTATGEGGSRLILDDPHSAQEAQSDKMRASALEWFDVVWSTRLNNPQRDAMVTIMQRLHEQDVSGRIMELGGWEHLCLPAEWDGIKRKTLLGSYDKRTTEGELLWPERFGEKELKRLKSLLGDYGVAGQLQQLPAPSGGGILKPDRFRLWPNIKALPPMEYILQSYDTAFTAATHNDPTACSVWGLFYWEGCYNVMLIDAWHDHLEYPDLRARVIREWTAKYAGDKTDPTNKARSPDLCLIEKKGSGQSLLQDLGQAKIVVAEYNPGNADKISRAHMITPLLDAGLVWIPESKRGDTWPTWADAMMQQLSRFPNAENDDYADSLTQALRYIRDLGYLTLARSTRYDDDARPPQQAVVNPYAQ